jgi:hypothetical protein
MENRMSQFGHLEDLMLQGQATEGVPYTLQLAVLHLLLQLEMRFLWHPHISTLPRVK